MTGTLTLSGYTVRDSLGSGAGSRIYRVEDPSNGQFYVLKRCVKREKDDLRFIEQLENEWKNAKLVRSDRVRQVFALKKVRKLLTVAEMHLIMEYFDGRSLDMLRPTAIPEIIRIFRDVAEGLDAIHKAGFVHADIKPNNILINARGEVKIIDMGQSCPINATKDRIQGTPDYIAPEQVERRPLDERTDIFNLGATFYWVLTHRTWPTVMQQLNDSSVSLSSSSKPIPPQEARPDMPAGLAKLLTDCLETAPQKRPRNMQQVITRLNMLEQLLNKQKVSVRTA